jgi:SRSO17 transposase
LNLWAFDATLARMRAKHAPGTQEDRFAAYMNGLAQAAGHTDREEPIKAYCKGLLLPGERKSVEPMAARLAPDNVRQTHQSLHHIVADSPWEDEVILRRVRGSVLPEMEKKSEVEAWIIDDTGFPKKGTHSVGVTRQYCGQLGKQDNCRIAVSLSVATATASLPIAWRLYLPEIWAKDRQRRKKAGVPSEIAFETKPQIALEQIRKAFEDGVTPAPVLADAAYGNDNGFRRAITELGLDYMLGVQSSTTVWKPGEGPLEAKPWTGKGRPATLLRRSKNHQPVSVKELAMSLEPENWKNVSWRESSSGKMHSRFAALRVRPAHRDESRKQPHSEEWLLIEWPQAESEPTKYWLSTLPQNLSLKRLVYIAKHRWIIERDYQELKQELGLGHYEGRGWRGVHHHATLCIAAYGFLLAERTRFSPNARGGQLQLSVPALPKNFSPRGSRPRRAPQPLFHRNPAH